MELEIGIFEAECQHHANKEVKRDGKLFHIRISNWKFVCWSFLALRSEWRNETHLINSWMNLNCRERNSCHSKTAWEFDNMSGKFHFLSIQSRFYRRFLPESLALHIAAVAQCPGRLVYEITSLETELSIENVESVIAIMSSKVRQNVFSLSGFHPIQHAEKLSPTLIGFKAEKHRLGPEFITKYTLHSCIFSASKFGLRFNEFPIICENFTLSRHASTLRWFWVLQQLRRISSSP